MPIKYIFIFIQNYKNKTKQEDAIYKYLAYQSWMVITMKESITYDGIFDFHPINTGRNHNYGCYTKILQKIDYILKSMLIAHSKIMITRFDIRFPYMTNIKNYSELVSEFDYNLKRKLNREVINGGHKVDAKTVYVEEQNTGEHPHFHFAVIVNANAKHKHYHILQIANELWMNMVNFHESGLVDFCKNYENGIIIDRNSNNFIETYDKVFYQVSYLAKINSKENRNKGLWMVRGSR